MIGEKTSADAETTVAFWTHPKHYPCRSKRRRTMNRKFAQIDSSNCLLLLVLISSLANSSAFQSTRITQTNNPTGVAHSSSQTALFVFPGFNQNDGKGGENDKENGWDPSRMLESFKNLFGNNDDESNKNPNAPAPIFSQFFQPPGLSSEEYHDEWGKYEDSDFEDEEDDEEDDLPAGTSLLFKFQAKQLKPGGLRLFLMFYLLGMQNTPDKNTWRADQRLMSVNASPKGFGDEASADEPEEKKYVLEMLYDVDRTGMLQIELLPEKGNKQAEIRIYRCGSRPSTSYLMQESLIVDGVLDELQNIAGEKDLATTIPRSDNPDVGTENEMIAEEDRLLITDPPNAIEAARESLAFS